MKNRIISLFIFLLIFNINGSNKTAYREKIITPHWEWVKKSKNGTVKAIFFVNNLAAREPYELEERFDIKATVVPVKGNAYGNYYDEKFILSELKKNYDVIVFAAREPFKNISPACKKAIKEKIENGTSAVIFGYTPFLLKEIKHLLNKDKKIENPDEIIKNIPLNTLHFKRKFGIEVYKCRGKIIIVNGYDLHWCFFTAFLPVNSYYYGYLAEPEIYYALASRIIRYASSKFSHNIENVDIKKEKDKYRIKINLKNPDSNKKILMKVYNRFGELIYKNYTDIKKPYFDFHPSQYGNLTFVIFLKDTSSTLDFFIMRTEIKPPLKFSKLEIPEIIKKTFDIKWETRGENEKGDKVYIQIYSPDGYLVKWEEENAEKKFLALKKWDYLFPVYKIRIILVRKEKIFDEVRKNIYTEFDRKNDSKKYNVILWSMEYGSFPEKFRFQIFRQTGIDAIAGKSEKVLKMASEEGLRVVPTNIFVPPNRYKPNFDREKEKENLKKYAEFISKFSPLGYSLADEPSEKGIRKIGMKDLCEFRNWAYKTISQYDKKAKVGYCGVWWGMDKNTDKYFKCCNYIGGYSPFHLYSIDLWAGIERDLYRSFLNPDSILTCWTGYAPGKDNEPYSRTVPWLWLFEGMNGVSYFSSAGEFGILKNNWGETNETRWWSEEIKEIKKGIGQQLISMKRDTGQIRILFHPTKNKNAENWAFALNRLNTPYKFMSKDDLENGIEKETKLIICPEISELSPYELKNIKEFVKRGGWVVFEGPAGIVKSDKIKEDEEIKNFMGINQLKGTVEIKKWEKDISIHKNIPVKVKWSAGNNQNFHLKGFTTGVHSIKVEKGKISGEIENIGSGKNNKENLPDFVEQILQTPAVIERNFEKGKIFYLTFYPDIESSKIFLKFISKQIGIKKDLTCNVNGKDDDTVYLYPFKNKKILIVGVIQDYQRVKPSFQIEGYKKEEEKKYKNTANYFFHGPYLWNDKNCILKFKEKRFIYDVRKEKYIGFSSKVDFKIKPGRPELFAFLPYRVKKINIYSKSVVKQGEKLNVKIKLIATEIPDEHIVNISLKNFEGKGQPISYLLRTEKGEGETNILIPLNIQSGKWFIEAQDSITGVKEKKEIILEKDNSILPHLILKKQSVKIEKIPLNLPEGKWVPYSNENKNPETSVKVKVNPIVRKRMYIWNNHRGHEYLSGGFSLTNSKISYQIRYLACNDWKKHKWKDKRKIWAPYLPGLGISKPQPHIWYYNGYIQVFLDDFNSTAYRISEIKKVKSGKNGRVNVTWDSPKGKVTLSFLLTPENPGLFQQLTVKPYQPIRKITIKFTSYPGGFSSPKSPFVYVSKDKNWAVLADKINDRRFGKGRGPGAILLLPKEFTSIKYDTHHTQLEKTIILNPGQKISFHWILYLFPEMANQQAIDYMKKNSGSAEKKLIKIFLF